MKKVQKDLIKINKDFELCMTDIEKDAHITLAALEMTHKNKHKIQQILKKNIGESISQQSDTKSRLYRDKWCRHISRRGSIRKNIRKY